MKYFAPARGIQPFSVGVSSQALYSMVIIIYPQCSDRFSAAFIGTYRTDNVYGVSTVFLIMDFGLFNPTCNHGFNVGRYP